MLVVEGVVGINLPTFVERARTDEAAPCIGGVVGINLPTFVERQQTPPSLIFLCRCRRD